MKILKRVLFVMVPVLILVLSIEIPSLIMDFNEVNKPEKRQISEMGLNIYSDLSITEKLEVVSDIQYMYQLDHDDLKLMGVENYFMNYFIYDELQLLISQNINFYSGDVYIYKETFVMAEDSMERSFPMVDYGIKSGCEYLNVSLDYETGVILRLSYTYTERNFNEEPFNQSLNDKGYPDRIIPEMSEDEFLALLVKYYNSRTIEGEYWFEDTPYAMGAYFDGNYNKYRITVTPKYINFNFKSAYMK